MRALLRMQWLNLKRDRGALALTFVLPVGFFSIFALVFGSMGGGAGGGRADLEVVCVDEDGSTASARLLETFAEQDGVAARSAGGEPAVPYTRESALSTVRAGDAAAAVLVPPGFGEAFGDFAGGGARVELVVDAANPLAEPMLTGLLQAASFRAAPDVLLERGMAALEDFGGGPLTAPQRAAMDSLTRLLDPDEEPAADGTAGGDFAFGGLIAVEASAAQADEESGAPIDMVAYYAAAIGVMFLLFSMAGAAGSILEQEEYGTLERLLTSRLGVGRLLLGHWIFFGVLGVVQLAIMFAWAAAVFGLDLSAPATLVGVTLMALFTSAAAAGFGLMLAALCRSRAQLSGVSTIVILTMSALGGSMMPRFIASFLETTSRFTFNGWALDGFLKVLWYREPGDGVAEIATAILPQLGILAAAALAFLAIARLAARRWEQV